MKLGIIAFLLTALCSVHAQGAESPYKIRIGFPLSSVFLHAFLRGAGKRHLQKIWHRLRIHSDGHRHPAASCR